MSKKYDFGYVKQYFLDRGCQLLELTYTNCNQKMRYRCECGKESHITFHKFMDGRRCKACGNRKRQQTRRKPTAKRQWTYDKAKALFEDNGCELSADYFPKNTREQFDCFITELSRT